MGAIQEAQQGPVQVCYGCATTWVRNTPLSKQLPTRTDPVTAGETNSPPSPGLAPIKARVPSPGRARCWTAWTLPSGDRDVAKS